MNLHTITIWTTGAMLILTLVVPTHKLALGASVYYVVDNIVLDTLILWLFSGSPLFISFVITLKSKRKTSSGILLVTTIIYVFLYAYAMHQLFYVYLGGLALLVVGIVSLPVMIPAWITALLLNQYYATKTPGPGTAFCSVPDTLKRENEVK